MTSKSSLKQRPYSCKPVIPFMGSKLVGLAASLDVGGEDIHAMGSRRRRETLHKVVQVAAPSISAIVGIIAGNETFPVHSRPDSFYPYASSAILLTASSTSSGGHSRWLSTVVVSAIVFIVAFLSLALLNGAVNDSYGVSPRYGVFHGRDGR